MKDLDQNKQNLNDLPLVEQVMNSKPEFASKEEAIKAYTDKLEALSKKCGRSIPQMLNYAEHSADFNEDCEEAMDLWMTLSLLKRK